jgi:signal transduction histidine kinase
MNLVQRQILIFAMSFLVLADRGWAQKIPNILVLHLQSPQLPANIIASKSIEQAMASLSKYQIYDEYLDENRLGINYPRTADSIQRKYAGQKMDLVFAIGREAMNFMLQYGDQIWPSVPKVFCVVDASWVPSNLPLDVTGVEGSYDMAPGIDLAIKLQPDLRHVFYIGGSSPRELNIIPAKQREFNRFSGKVDVTYLNQLTWRQLLHRVSQLPDHSAVLFATYYRDATGELFMTPEACRMVSAASNAPVYGTLDTVLDSGVIGGSIFSITASTRTAASLGVRILRGEPISHVPIDQRGANEIVVNWSVLKKWGIPEKRIPAGVRVINREPTIWEEHKQLILLAISAFIIQTCLIIVLLLEKRRRLRSDRTVKLLTMRVINISEEERRHIARELHDDIGQRLSLISSHIDLLHTQQKAGNLGEEHNLKEPLAELNTLILDIHELSHSLHPSKLEHLGLKIALAELCRQLSGKHNLQIDLRTDQIPATLNSDISLCFYRIAQEALNNVIRHSGANSVLLAFSRKNGRVRMQIRDSGRGFDIASAPLGLGLTAMEERARIVDGSFALASMPGEGTTITVELALDKTFPVNA